MTEVRDSLSILSDEAISLGRWIAEHSDTGGRSDYFNFHSIESNFPHIEQLVLLETIHELEESQMILTEDVIGGIPHVLQPTALLFEHFDPLIYQTSPRYDAARIAQHLLESEVSSVSALELCEVFSWGVRRINPALSIVGEFISITGRYSPDGQPFTVGVFLQPKRIEREQLTAFVGAVFAESSA